MGILNDKRNVNFYRRLVRLASKMYRTLLLKRHVGVNCFFQQGALMRLRRGLVDVRLWSPFRHCTTASCDSQCETTEHVVPLSDHLGTMTQRVP